jgi:predicted GNAT superfamily acetyltransferase
VTIEIHIIETPQALEAVEVLQREIWSGNDIEIVPVHIFQAVVHNGGLVVGAYSGDQLVGFVFGFPGIDSSSGKPRLIHASHMAGVHPKFRDSGLGFKLKRAQWQMVRKQGIDRITWTYDPLQSRNANLNISKLGAVCNIYIPNYYGEMRDEINFGMPSDRFQVDWWVNSNRVERRLSEPNNRRFDLDHYLDAEVPQLNKTQLNKNGFVTPHYLEAPVINAPLLLVEIPSDFPALKVADPDLAVVWSTHIKALFLDLFAQGYFVTDFVFFTGLLPRSFYVLCHGDVTL